jgi:hypothetical protein
LAIPKIWATAKPRSAICTTRISKLQSIASASDEKRQSNDEFVFRDVQRRRIFDATAGR